MPPIGCNNGTMCCDCTELAACPPACHARRSSTRVRELRLFDVASTAGVAADLGHIATAARVSAHSGSDALPSALFGAHLVVIPAGVPRKPGMTRDDLFNINAGGRQAEAGVHGAFLAVTPSKGPRQRQHQCCTSALAGEAAPLHRWVQASYVHCARVWPATAPTHGWPSSLTPSTPPFPSPLRCSSARARSTRANCLA